MKCKVWLSSLDSTPLDPERNSSSRTMGGYAQVVRRPWLVVEEGGRQLLWQEEGLKNFNGEDYLLIYLTANYDSVTEDGLKLLGKCEHC